MTRPTDEQPDRPRHPDDLTPEEAREYAEWAKRRREASWRMPPLPDGRRDPWGRRTDGRSSS